MLHKIIPYQELLGNYDVCNVPLSNPVIIPYQELLGNYDVGAGRAAVRIIIPYQELLGNYDARGARLPQGTDYTIPRAIREL